MRRDDSSERPKRDVTRPRSMPGQAWACGYSDLGQCCRSGPTCDGRCGRTVDESAAASSGVSVSENAQAPDSVAIPPCIPRRSLAARRQSLRLNLAILTGGLLMLCMTLPSREKIFVPGELSSTHAQILDNTIQSQRCGLCHPTSHAEDTTGVGNQIVSGLLNSAKRLIENDGRQDQLCMYCHQGHLPAAVNRDPHDLSPEMWRQLQKSGDTPWQLVSSRTAMDGTDNSSSPTSERERALSKTSCAMCHNEHHGRGFDVKLISDSRCQACHQRQFESLASGHPEFSNFPVDRPRGLAFSHGQHARDHFPKKNRDFDCKACHVSTAGSGSSDRVTRSLSFEHACASCHDQPIRAATVEGWAAIQLPSIESEDAANDLEFADWPAAARNGYDGVVSPVMRALLMADPAAVDALDKLPASGQIVDISSISTVRARIAKTLALATKRLMEETARDGQAAWVARLQKATQTHLNRNLTEHELSLIAAMAAGVPPDLFRQVDGQWLGNRTPLAQRGLVQGQLVNATPLQSVKTTPTADTDDLLVEQSSSDNLLEEPTKSDAARDLLLGATEPATEKPVSKVVKGATHLAGGGWYADQSTLSIRYMPTGHADATLSAWTLWWSLMESHRAVLPAGEAERFAQRLNLASSIHPEEQNLRLADTIPGKCTECHQLDSLSTKFASRQSFVRLTDPYQVQERNPSAREFTKFQHTAHLTLPSLADCRYCHQEKSSQPIVPATVVSRHHPVMSEFATMKVSQCAACHRPGGANDRCVQCHNYHVSELP